MKRQRFILHCQKKCFVYYQYNVKTSYLQSKSAISLQRSHPEGNARRISMRSISAFGGSKLQNEKGLILIH
jgi:hypothetical protein